MKLGKQVCAIFGLGPRPNKGAAAFATVGAVVGGGIASHFFPLDHTADYLLFAATVIACSGLGGGIGLVLPEAMSSKWGESAKNGLIWLVGGLGGVLMAVASIVKLAETRDPAFIVALVFFGSCAIVGLGFPRSITSGVGALGLAVSSVMLFFFTGEIIGIVSAAFFTWVAMRALTRNA